MPMLSVQKKKRTIADSLCDSGGIQTHNLLIRSQMLYSVELRNLSWRLISQLRMQRYYIFFRQPNFFAFEFCQFLFIGLIPVQMRTDK